jgi:competence protein ComEC
MKRPRCCLLLVLLLISSFSLARPAKPLQIYFIDVEGGQATLVVSPAGESVLIDTGWAGARDADRIVAAAKAAGLKRIDYVFITHFHQDHVGGVADLLLRIPVGLFVDHGPNQEDSDRTRSDYAAYEKATEHSKRVHLKPSEGVPLKGVTLQVLAAAGQVITDPLPSAGEANLFCNSESAAQEDKTENAQSLGVLITYGKFRFLDLGDLTKKKELELVCPNNLIGTVDLYLVTHHGAAADNPKSLVWALRPRVAIMNNGDHKGGSGEAWQMVHDSPGLAELWQLHYAMDAGKEHNVAADLIANVDTDRDGHSIRVVAKASGSFTVINSRNGYSRQYAPK